MGRTTRTAIIIAITVALFMTIAIILGPRKVSPNKTNTGNPELAINLEKQALKGTRNIAAFTLSNGQSTFAGLGANEHTEFEIGSVTKTFTAQLLQNALDRGELTLDTTVGDIIDTHGSAISDVTLEELANHTSGLPRLSRPLRGFLVGFGLNPYGEYRVSELFDDARSAKLTNRGDYSYSNFGVALLGQLIATVQGQSFEELLNEEIFKPLGMHETYLMSLGSVPATAPRGVMANGHRSQPWEMEADLPMGGIRSTAYDIRKYTQHLLDNGIPEFTWATEESGVRWHNGGTGGFSSMLVLDPASKTAAFTINDSTADVDALALNLLEGLR